MRKIVFGLMLILFLLILPSVMASIPIYIKPLDGTGELQPSTTFTYTFNWTMNDDCTNVILSNTTKITTDQSGVGYVSIPSDSLNSIPNYLCEYRGSSLRKIHLLSDQTFRNIFVNNLYARNGNFSQNISANWFKGNLNWSDVQNAPISDWLSTFNSTYDAKVSFNNTNLAYTNQTNTFTANQTFNQNIIISDTGFFGWLGSVVNRITKLWITDIDVSNNINVTRNITLQINSHINFGNGFNICRNNTGMYIGNVTC